MYVGHHTRMRFCNSVLVTGFLLCVVWSDNGCCQEVGGDGLAGGGGPPQQPPSSPQTADTHDSADRAPNPQDQVGGGDSSHGNGTVRQSEIDITMETANPGLPFPVPPGVVVIFMDSQRVLHPSFTLRCPHVHARYVVSVMLRQLSHSRVGRLSAPVSVALSCEDAVWNDTAPDGGRYVLSGAFNVSLSSNLLGKALLLFSLQTLSTHSPAYDTSSAKSTDGPVNTDSAAASATTSLSPHSHAALPANSSTAVATVVHRAVVLVVRPLRVIDVVFRATAYIIVIVATIAMGCKTDLQVVRHTLRTPAAPIIGFCCQYIAMPLIAYGVARGLKLDNPLVSFGIFACGVCPGGGASNMYSYLLGGDLSLSITLTIISTIASLGMIPLWLFTLGGTLETGGLTVAIPYLKILETLATIILPLFVGIFLQYRFPRVAKFILKIIKPVFVVALIFMLSVGIYANMYIFRLFEPMTILAGCMLPYIGYIVGGGVSLACRQPWPRVKTIALETGIQNVSVAFLILIFSLPPPDGELAAVGPAASAVMTGIPPLLVTLVYIAYNRARGRPSPHQHDRRHKHAMLGTELNRDIVVRTDEKKDTDIARHHDNGDAEHVKLTKSQSTNGDV